MLAVTKDEEED